MKYASIKTSNTENSLDGQLCCLHQNGKKLLKIPHNVIPNFRTLVEQGEEGTKNLQKYISQQNESTYIPLENVEIIAPLPRTFGWLDGSAFIQHVKLVRAARNAPLPETLTTVPLMYQGGSDSFLSYNENIPLLNPNWGLDFEGEIGIVTKFVPQGTKAENALKYIFAFVMINDITLRELIPAELAQGFGFLQSKPSSTLSPYVVSLDEMIENQAFDPLKGKLTVNFNTNLNGKFFGNPNLSDMFFSFYQLMEHATKTRSLAPATIIGSGTVSNEDKSRGSSCIVEKRMIEIIESKVATTPYLQKNDVVEMNVFTSKGTSPEENIFGTIHQVVG